MSRAAPYHHFTDRNELLRQIAIEGYQRLIERFRKAVKGKRSYEQKAAALTQAYLAFAREDCNYYKTMFVLEIDENLEDEILVNLATEAFMFIRNIIAESKKGKKNDDPSELTVAVWSFLHGMVSLEATGALQLRLPRGKENRIALQSVLRIIAADSVR